MGSISNTAIDCRGILHLFRLGKNRINTDCRECQIWPDQVICLGEDQAFMMEIMIADELQWEIREGKPFSSDVEFQNISSELKCKKRLQDLQSSPATILWDEDLIEEETISFLAEHGDRFKLWKTVFESIIVTLAINSCYQVTDRDSLTHLCMNGKGGAILFRKVIMKTMSMLAANWYQKEELEQIATNASNFLHHLVAYKLTLNLEENMKSRRKCLVNRIARSNINMLHPLENSEEEESKISERGNGDILTYFAYLERGERKYYASRLSLMKQAFGLAGQSEIFEIPPNLYQINEKSIENKQQIDERPIENSYTRKISEILHGMNRQEDGRKNEAARRLSTMFDQCTDEWIDEEINDMLEWINS